MTDTFSVGGDFSPAHSDAHLEKLADIAAADTNPIAEVSRFIAMGLAPELLQALQELNFTQPTAVQDKVVPIAMTTKAESEQASKFNDLMVSSQTGSGKTVAFLLPILHIMLGQRAEAEAQARAAYEQAEAQALASGQTAPKRAKRKDPTNPRNYKAATPAALILCPTRELAQQVAQDAINLVRHCRGIRVANVVGGMPYQLQLAKLHNADVVVATPGRLLDLQRSMQIKLDQVQFFVVDEADRMLDLGFSEDLAELNQLTAQRQQTMMFSATFASRIQQLAERIMRKPQRIQIDSPQEKHVNITQQLFWADNAYHKRKLLDHWLRDTSINQAIVFASTQIECDGLANDLQQDGFSAVALHGALSQGLRNRRLMALRQGQVQILVATDVAARGLDVPTITHVFNFGLPMKAEDYTHRIGRTGRAGRDGIAVTFAELRDRRKIFDIEHYTRQPLKANVIEGLEPQQRVPDARPPRGNFGGGGGFGGGGRGGDRGNSHRGSGDRPGFGASRTGGAGGFGGGSRPDRGSYAGASGFNERSSAPRRPEGAGRGGFGGGGFAAAGSAHPRSNGEGHQAPRREDSFAPRADFAARKPAPSRAGFAKPATGGKPFVPQDARKRFTKAAR